MTSPTNEQQRVDVIAVMEDAARLLYLNAPDERAECEARDACDALLAAKKAVAELIEAVRPIVDLAELFDDELRGGNMPKDDSDPIMQWPRVHKEYELKVGHLRNLRAALANVGAAK